MRFISLRIILTAMSLLAPATASGQGAAMTAIPASPRLSSPPLVIAHRGASGERPEHTLASYARAIEQGADVIEPDLVPTRDDVLVARHENEIGGTTDVADHPEFADRRTTRTIDGQKMTGWFTEDFTLAELKTLRAKERLPALRPGNTAWDGRETIPTFAEIIALAKARGVAIYPETKHPSYFASIGHPTDRLLVDQLRTVGWDSADAPVFIQSFEVDNLRRLAAMTGIRLIQLVAASSAPADGAAPSYAAMMTPGGLTQVARYAWGIGPDKAMLWQGDAPTTLVADAHAVGLRVHPWTYRAENTFVRARFRRGDVSAAHGDLSGEIAAALRQGVDGFFTDFPAIGVATRDAFVAGEKK